MSVSKDKNSLFSEFPKVSTAEWENKIKEDLKGADYREKLRWKTGEGIEALPFYRQEDLALTDRAAEPRYPHARKNDWEIRQTIFDLNIGDANESARQALENGVNGLQFKLEILSSAGATGSDLRGTAIQSQQDFDKLLEGIEITSNGLHFDSGPVSPIFLAMLYNFCKKHKVETREVNGTLLYDPWAFILTNGRYPKNEDALVRDACQMTDFCNSTFPGVRCLGVDAQVYHNSGATLVQELGFAMAAGNEYVSRLTDSGFSVDEVAPRIHFNFSIGSNYFLEIAKFRASRILWPMIIGPYTPEQPDSSLIYIHGRTSEWNKTVFDPHTNLLRTTTEGMAGVVAGCDAVTLDPFDMALNKPDNFSRRLARNIQIILKEEAYFDKVVDPSAGSYYIEVLTDKIAEAAWDCFREVEQQGGILRAIQNGFIQTSVQESRIRRDQAIAEQRRVFVGTNKYANASEKRASETGSAFTTVSLKSPDTKANVDVNNLVVSVAKALNNGAQSGDLAPALLDYGKEDIQTLSPYRGSSAFDELRMATEHHSSTPKVLTLPVGNKQLRKARSAFAVSFFSCVGYHIMDPIGFDKISEAVKVVSSEQPDIVVLCGSDKEYPQLVPQLCDQLEELEKRPLIVLAGYPEKDITRYESFGVDVFIHRGSNVLETLTWFQKKLGVL